MSVSECAVCGKEMDWCEDLYTRNTEPVCDECREAVGDA